ncbi:MAG: hypothetical protein JWM31_1966 [Solirubrobacterales bacterium]|nr:hypothetical protein [Solirubrobacterales bacterium]
MRRPPDPGVLSGAMSDEPSFDLDAAGLRADQATLGSNVEVLAAKLEEALPGACVVSRRSRRLFSKDKVVESIEVTLGTVRYTLGVDGSRVEATRAQEVRGIVIKREPLPVAAWIAGITDTLREQAGTSAQARAALEQLLA